MTVVQVVLDMAPERAGFQSNVNVTPGASVVTGVAVYVLDPAGLSCLWGIGYLGGIDRGIAFGHMPDDANMGAVEFFEAQLGTPIGGDGIVGNADFLGLLGAWGLCTGPCPPSCPADLDGDCSVGITDLLALLANWS